MVGGAPEQVTKSCFQPKHTTTHLFSHSSTKSEMTSIFFNPAGGAADRLGGGSAESSPYFSRRRQGVPQPPERYQSCMALPSEGLVEPLERLRDRTRTESHHRGAGTGGSSSGPGSPRSINSAPCGLEEHLTGSSRLGLALPLGLTHSSPTASPQRMEWKVSRAASPGLQSLLDLSNCVVLLTSRLRSAATAPDTWPSGQSGTVS